MDFIHLSHRRDHVRAFGFTLGHVPIILLRGLPFHRRDAEGPEKGKDGGSMARCTLAAWDCSECVLAQIRFCASTRAKGLPGGVNLLGVGNRKAHFSKSARSGAPPVISPETLKEDPHCFRRDCFRRDMGHLLTGIQWRAMGMVSQGRRMT